MSAAKKPRQSTDDGHDYYAVEIHVGQADAVRVDYATRAQAERVRDDVLAAAEQRSTVRIVVSRRDNREFVVLGDLVLDLAAVGRTFVSMVGADFTSGAPGYKR